MAELRAEEGLGQPVSGPPQCCAYVLLHSCPHGRTRAHAAAPQANQEVMQLKIMSCQWHGRVLIPGCLQEVTGKGAR